MTDHIIVDVEIEHTIEETPGGWNATNLLGVAVACVWEYQGERMRIYGPRDVNALRERLLAADRIGGFNIMNFDFPVIWGLPKPEWMTGTSARVREIKEKIIPKTDDMLQRIWLALKLNPNQFAPATHGGWKLDDVVKATLNSPGKISDGASAPREYQKGNWGWVCNYCADDVALERDLSNFIDRYGYVRNRQSSAVLYLKPWGMKEVS